MGQGTYTLRICVYSISNLVLQPNPDLFKAAFCEPDLNQPEGHIYGQTFTDDVFNAEYNNICDLARQENCHHEVIMPVIMSDSGSLAQSGTAELV